MPFLVRAAEDFRLSVGQFHIVFYSDLGYSCFIGFSDHDILLQGNLQKGQRGVNDGIILSFGVFVHFPTPSPVGPVGPWRLIYIDKITEGQHLM